MSLALYINDRNDSLPFTTDLREIAAHGIEPFYTSENVPPGWPRRLGLRAGRYE